MPIDPLGSSDCGAAAIAQLNFTDLSADATFTLPAVDLTGTAYQLPPQTGELYNDVDKLTNADLTSGTIGGAGTFDVIMASVHAHLKGEFDKQRITGDQYAKAYIELTTAALGTASQYLLGRDQAYWAAVLTQSQARAAEIEAVTAGVQLETSKAQLQIAFYEAYRSEAEYALSKMKLATEDAQFCLIKAQTDTARYNLDNMLPEQLAQLQYTTASIMPAQLAGMTADTAIKTYQLNTTMPTQVADIIAETAIKTYQVGTFLPSQVSGILAETDIKEYQLATFLPAQVSGIVVDNQMKTYQYTNFMPVQLEGIQADTAIKEYNLSDMLPQQKTLLQEQTEVQRAQTMDTRTDGLTNIEGAVGKQKDLYDQQIDSYIKDAQYKVAKMFLDSWITRKTIDEGIAVPNQFGEAEIDEIMILLRSNNSLGS